MATDGQREQLLYLLRELGFDTVILQGLPSARDLRLDDPVVVAEFKKQLKERAMR